MFSLKDSANVGLLDVGKNNHIRIRLRNTLSHTVELGKISASCGCVRVVCDADQVEPGESCTIDVKLKPDHKYGGRVWSQSITFDPPEVPTGSKQGSLTISLRANLAGVFHLKSDRILFDVPARSPGTQVLTRHVHLLVTPPIKLKNIDVSGSGLFELFDVTLKPNDDPVSNGIMSVSIAAEDIPSNGMHCGIVLTDRETNQRRVVAISSVKRPAIRVVPSTIRMRRDDKGRGWEGYGLVIRGNSTLLANDDIDGKTNDSVVANAAVKGTKLKIEVMQGGAFARRFRISLPDSRAQELDDTSQELNTKWDITWGSDRAGPSSRIILSSR